MPRTEKVKYYIQDFKDNFFYEGRLLLDSPDAHKRFLAWLSDALQEALDTPTDYEVVARSQEGFEIDHVEPKKAKRLRILYPL